MTDVKILEIEALVAALTELQSAIEPVADSDLNYKAFVWKDADGVTYKCLAKSQPGLLTTLKLTGGSTTGGEGVLVHDTNGDITGNADVLTALESVQVTATRIPFGNATGEALEESADLTWDDTEKELTANGEVIADLIRIHERTTPGADASVGAVYPKADNKLYFQDGAGTEHEIAVDPKYAEMYDHDATETVTINTASVYHAIRGLLTGVLSGWTFDAGRQVDADISAEADNTQLRITTSAAHGLTTGDIVCLSNMNNAGHDGVTAVTYVDTTNFDCDDIAYVADAGASAGVVDEPSYLQAGATAAGVYQALFQITGNSAVASKTFKLALFIGATEQTRAAVESTPGDTELFSESGTGLLTVAVGDRIWLGIQDKTDTTNFVYEHINVNLHKF